MRPRWQLYRNLAVPLVVGALLATSACGSNDSGKDTSSSPAKKPLQVLYVGGVTGLLAPTTAAAVVAIRAHVDAINEAGGINGRKVELTVKDSQSDPTRSATLVQEAANGDKKPDLVVPGTSSNEVLAVSPILTRNEIVAITTAGSPVLNDVSKFPYFFSVGSTSDPGISAALGFIKDKGGSKIALVVPNDAIGDATVSSYKKAATGTGVQISQAGFAGDSLDFTPAFQKALSGDPDWIAMEGSGTQVATLLSSRVKAGADKIPGILGKTASSAPILDLAKGNELDQLYISLYSFQAYVPPAERSPEFNDFYKRLSAQGKLTAPLGTYGSFWDVIGRWANAVSHVKGTVNGPAIKDALETTPPNRNAQFPMYGGSYSPQSHFYPSAPTDFHFGIPDRVEDDMFVLK